MAKAVAGIDYLLINKNLFKKENNHLILFLCLGSEMKTKTEHSMMKIHFNVDDDIHNNLKFFCYCNLLLCFALGETKCEHM